MKMKTVLSLIFTLSFFVAQAQNVDKIVAKHIESLGGLEKLKAIKSKVRTMSMSIQGQDVTMVSYEKRENKLKVVMEAQGMEFVTNCFDGKTGWRMNQMGGTDKYSDKENKESAANTFDGIWTDYKEKGHTIKLAGKEKVDGKECFKLEVTRKDGQTRTVFMSTDDYMILKTVSTNPSGATITRYLSDYKAVAGVKFHHKMRVEAGQTIDITISSIKINEKIDDKIFAYPGE
ncbi:hypothetical protein BKI52_09435 [marine bacterium AO1-C]|nr:hypothetical protein BKI52_09435 [marine bacterium AO1-C]